MKQAFVLSDCELPECNAKVYALLVANPTKGHHYIAQTEQRQYAFNPHVNTQNQNVYAWPLSRFAHPPKGEVLSVNIENNLEGQNLYTLTFAENNDGKQYNLESWFNRHESGYEEACMSLRASAAGKRQADKALYRVLKLKLLSLLRNPLNKNEELVQRLTHSLDRHLPLSSPAFSTLIAARPQAQLHATMREFGFSLQEYTQWLSNLYALLSEGVHQPSLFERLFYAIFAEEQAVRIELYRYSDPDRYCFFPDSGYCLQASKQELSIGFGLAFDMFVIIHISQHHWANLSAYLFDTLPVPKNDFYIHDNQHIQRITFNRLCIRQAHAAVYGNNQQSDMFL